ncbi:TnsA-like heteromeric transposase endonuclease subunit [Agrococcus sp. Ld7]|uniref:TnsA-like heteromeric transposase endonuclease subunit n=1 Tax=Agrococcus sp. Ld7 TaxID=649148 RepID=UPI00386967DF
MSGDQLPEAEVRYLTEDDESIDTTLAKVDLARLARARPVRRVRSYARQRHYSGLYWSFKNRDHVVYESRLELARLLVADIDPATQRIAAQPMQLVGVDGSRMRRHVPDFLIVRIDDRPLVVDVKPARFAAKPEVADVLRWTARLCSARGLDYQVWSGTDPVVIRNIEWLQAARRRPLPVATLIEKIRGMAETPIPLGQLLSQTSATHQDLFRLVWHGTLQLELASTLSDETAVWAS